MVHETALIKKCQRGDRQAFDDLIRLYYDYIFGFLLKSTMDKDLTEDLTQETFLKMIRNIERFDPDGRVGFGTWLVTIAKNSYIDHLRRNRIFLENIRGGFSAGRLGHYRCSGTEAPVSGIAGCDRHLAAGAGAGDPAEIRGGHDLTGDCCAVWRAAQGH